MISGVSRPLEVCHGEGDAELLDPLPFLANLTGLVAPARQIALEQGQKPRDTGLGGKPVRDVLAGKGFLVHLGVHVTGIHPVDLEFGLLRCQHVGKLLERSLARAVPAPAGVGFHPGIRGDIHDAGSRLQHRQGELDQPQGSQDVDPIDLLEHLEGILGEVRLGARPQDRGIVDEHVEATQFLRGFNQGLEVPVIRHVPGDRHHLSLSGEFGSSMF